jgi:hypothetical protein
MAEYDVSETRADSIIRIDVSRLSAAVYNSFYASSIFFTPTSDILQRRLLKLDGSLSEMFVNIDRCTWSDIPKLKTFTDRSLFSMQKSFQEWKNVYRGI